MPSVPSALCRAFLLLLASVPALYAQSSPVHCVPANERKGDLGCWIMATVPWSATPNTAVYWSLDRFPTMESAQAATGPNGQAFHALDQFWVFTLSSRDDRPSTGTHITQIGPLPLKAHAAYTAQYMEAVLAPGAETVIHRHPGVEAFYTESGESCLETPAGKRLGRKHEDVIVPEGEPMVLVASGKENRRSLILVLHDGGLPWTTMAADWTPKGLCKQ